MSDKILLTLAIPTYNNSGCLASAIQSCVNQIDLDNCEILIVNNASTDATKEIILEFQHRYPKINVIHNHKTVSLYENHNICLKNSQGRYVVFCHSDDRLAVDATKILKDKLKVRGYPRKYIFWGHSLFRDYSKNISNYGIETDKVFAGERAILPFLAGGLTPSGTCYSRDIIDHGGFLDAKHPLASTDSSSCVLFVLEGYRFEMFANIIFYRKDASTALIKTSNHDWISSYKFAYDTLMDKINNEEKNILIRSINNYSFRPALLFLIYLSDIQPYLVLKAALIHAIIRPWLFGKTFFYAAILRSIKSIFLQKTFKKLKM